MILVSNLSITYFLGIRYIKSVSKMKPYRFDHNTIEFIDSDHKKETKNRSPISYN